MLSENFIYSGNATFTVGNGKGKHYTFRIQKKKADRNFAETFFAKVLTGPNNNEDYTYIGILNKAGNVVLTNASKFKESSIPVALLEWVMKHIKAQVEFPLNYSVNHSGRCGRCGRTLTTPRSIEIGLGPVCEGKS